MLVWNDSYSVGVKKFDEQHQRLFELMNNLNQGASEGQDKFILGRILDELVDYTGRHFLAEELEMMTNDYPEYEVHKAEHDKLKSEVRDFYSKYYAGEVVITDNLLDFLIDWLKNHIATTDKRYSGFFAEKGVK